MRTRVKFCGFTRPEDAIKAAQLGVDALGLVFYPKSPRYLSIADASAIFTQIPAFVTVVGLFVDGHERDIMDVLQAIPLDMLQFHGNESPKFCESFGKPYLKTIHMRQDVDLQQACIDYSSARAILLDTYVKDIPGGSGISFDWDKIPKNLTKPLILAGGLNSANIFAAIQKVRPYGVDVSSGIELEKGIKDPHKMTLFMQEVNHVDRI